MEIGKEKKIKKIEKRHKIVEGFISDSILRKTIQDEYLKLCPDFDNILKRLQKMKVFFLFKNI
jgi:DNA mismatch repair ATPase MutS